MSDSVVELQKVSQNLGRAYNAYQGSSFAAYFAAKLMPNLTDEQRKMRLQLLRMMSQLVDTEFKSAMEDLVDAWAKYKEAEDASGG